MTTTCCAPDPQASKASRNRFTLWFALIVNVVMAAVELGAGLVGQSSALLADALDFFSDAANYAITLVVVALGARRHAQAAIAKAASMAALGAFAVGRAIWSAIAGSAPHAETMGVIAVIALVANAGVASAFFAWRDGDANMRSVWLCSRNDAAGNVAVLIAAVAVAATDSRWPDLVVALMIGALNLHAARQVVAQARRELAGAAPVAGPVGVAAGSSIKRDRQ